MLRFKRRKRRLSNKPFVVLKTMEVTIEQKNRTAFKKFCKNSYGG